MSKYKLIEKKLTYTDKFILTIKADSNDGDYITETEIFTKEDFENILDEIINLRDNYGGHHELRNYPNQKDLYIPYNGWDGYCHTLEELTVEYIDKDGKIWDIEF